MSQSHAVLIAEIADLKEQRDELLEACKAATGMISGSGGFSIHETNEEIFEKLYATIARAIGGRPVTHAKHTPGPWTWDRVPLPGVGPTAVADVLNAKHGTCILRHDANGITPWVPTDADRALIAASPDLLTVLKELTALVRGESPRLLNEDSGGDATLSFEIDAAIAKAEGRTNG